MSIKAPIGKRLKEARKRSGLTQKEVGVRAGIVEENASTKINQYEKGVYNPRFPRLANLAKVLNVPIAYFYADEDELAEIVHQYGSMSKQGKKRLVSKIKKAK